MMAFDVHENTSDETLLHMFATGDKSVARTLVLRHAPGVLAVATRMLKDQSEAEDVTQETLLRLWKIAPDWKPERAKISTWLYRVAANLCMDRLRKNRGVSLTLVPELVDETPSVETQMITRDRAEALNSAMRDLPTRQRLAITLRHFQELSNPKIADIMDTSVEAVESLLARGRRSLTRSLTCKLASTDDIEDDKGETL